MPVRVKHPKLICLFISHVFARDHDRQAFHRRLEQAWPKGAVYRVLEPSKRHHEGDLSKSEIKTFLKQQIAEADVLIVVAARYAADSEWMQFEVRTAQELGVPVLLVKRAPKSRCPIELRRLCRAYPTELESLRANVRKALTPERRNELRELELEHVLGEGRQAA
jgi:hypothetical protein